MSNTTLPEHTTSTMLNYSNYVLNNIETLSEDIKNDFLNRAEMACYEITGDLFERASNIWDNEYAMSQGK
tara:strand:- start:225 stop:434 length:210 start_codon:yes stop_codon:yes gene_type:complete